MPAFSLISFNVARPRSAMPSFDNAVPAPVLYKDLIADSRNITCMAYECQNWELTMYKQSKPSLKAILAVSPSYTPGHTIILSS